MNSPAQRSLWEATAVPLSRLPTLSGSAETEVAIIGGGYAGLSTALHLAERGVATILLEANDPGAGASGRNGGQVIPGLRHFVEDLDQAYEPETAARLHAWGADTADYTFSLIRRLGLDCEATRAGWINAASGPAERLLARRRAEAWMAKGAPIRLLEADELAKLTGSQAYDYGFIDERGGSVQPLSLSRELARAAALMGASLFAHSPALSIESRGAGWVIKTPNGQVSARKVLVATNALSGSVWPRLSECYLPVWSFQIATDPLPPELNVCLSGAAVSDMRRVLRYFRRDRDGRLIVGGKGTIGSPRGPGSFTEITRIMARLYPALAETKPSWYWGGQVAVTLDRLPRLFSLGDGLVASLACNGKGVAWNVALGSVLADILTGADPRDLPLPPPRPLQPIRFHRFKQAYTAAGSAWLRLQDFLDINTSRVG